MFAQEFKNAQKSTVDYYHFHLDHLSNFNISKN